MPRELVAAVIIQYGHFEETRRCIKSVLASERKPDLLILVDNASPDDAAARLTELLAELNAAGAITLSGTPAESSAESSGQAVGCAFLKAETNRGYAAGNNMGIRLAMESGASQILILNNDAQVETKAIGAMSETLANKTDAGLCGAMLMHPDAKTQCLAGGRTNWATGLSKWCHPGLSFAEAEKISAEEVEKELNFICGACVMVSRRFIETAGYMDEGYFLYCEEQDWALRGKGKFKLAYAASAVAWHYEGVSTGWNWRSFNWRQALRLCKSRLRLAWLHHPLYLPSVAMSISYAAGRQIFKKMARKIFSPGAS